MEDEANEETIIRVLDDLEGHMILSSVRVGSRLAPVVGAIHGRGLSLPLADMLRE